MGPKIVLLTLVIFTVILQTKSDTNGLCENCRRMPEYTRIKRAKYYGPQKFYRRPPINYPTKGAFSYTPPPGYMMDEEKYPANFRPKVSKATNDGLGDEDINNLVKHLSKKDLDKIIEFAGEKGRYIESNRDEYRPSKRPDFKAPEESDTFSLNSPYINKQGYANIRDNPKDYQELEQNHYENANINYINEGTQPRILYSNPPNIPPQINQGPNVYQNQPHEHSSINDATKPRIIYSNPPDIPPLHNPGPISFLNQNTQGNIFTDSTVMKEEPLPKPSNLREDDFEISYTSNVAKVVKSESSSYKLENFGELPLMNYYDSKLHSVSSYKVPHYTVTSPKPHPSPLSSSSSSSSSQVPLELAPEGATGKDQSDAHLKAIRIWTHKSKGTAYTLHDDGTLSLEKPKYGRS